MLAGAAVGLVASAFVARALLRGWSAAGPVLASASYEWLLAGFGLAALAMTWMAWCWHLPLELLGAPVAPRTSMGWYFVGELGKYVPGGIWPVVGRAELARRGGVPRPCAYLSVGLSLVALYVAGALVAACLLPFAVAGGGGAGPWVLALLSLPIGMAALHPRVLGPALARARRLSRREIAVAVPRWGSSVSLVGSYAPCWLLVALSTWSIAHAVAPGAPFARVGFAAVLSWLAGFLAVPVPAGVGVREAVLVATSGLPAEVAVLVAIASRVVFVGADVLGAVVAGGAGWRRLAPVRPGTTTPR